MDSVTVAIGTQLKELKDQIGKDHYGEKKSIHVITKSTNLMAHNQ